MIKTVKVYYVRCDVCGSELYHPGDIEHVEDLCFNKEEIIEVMDEYNWFEHEGKIICCECVLKSTEEIDKH